MPAFSSLSVEKEVKIKGGDISGIIQETAKGIQAQAANPSKDALDGYAAVLNAVASLAQALPKEQKVTFQLTKKERDILAVYAVGGLLMMLAASLIPNAGLKGSDLMSVLLYWTSVVVVLLGAQALPSILGKGSGGP